jgi:hypothetical protein
VRDFSLGSFAFEDTVELLALLCRRVLDLDRSSLRDDLLGSVRTNQALEAVRLHVYITLVSIPLSLKSVREDGTDLEPFFDLLDLLLKEFVFL